MKTFLIVAGIVILFLVILYFVVGAMKKKKDAEKEVEQTESSITVSAKEGQYITIPANAEISKAIYGTETSQKDVTAIVNAIYDATGSANFVVSNNALGGDPVPGSLKTLTVTYTRDPEP